MTEIKQLANFQRHEEAQMRQSHGDEIISTFVLLPKSLFFLLFQQTMNDRYDFFPTTQISPIIVQYLTKSQSSQ